MTFNPIRTQLEPYSNLKPKLDPSKYSFSQGQYNEDQQQEPSEPQSIPSVMISKSTCYNQSRTFSIIASQSSCIPNAVHPGPEAASRSSPAQEQVQQVAPPGAGGPAEVVNR